MYCENCLSAKMPCSLFKKLDKDEYIYNWLHGRSLLPQETSPTQVSQKKTSEKVRDINFNISRKVKLTELFRFKENFKIKSD